MGLITKNRVKLYTSKKGNKYLAYNFRNKNNEIDVMYIAIPDEYIITEVKNE